MPLNFKDPCTWRTKGLCGVRVDPVMAGFSYLEDFELLLLFSHSWPLRGCGAPPKQRQKNLPVSADALQ